jgi:hypothetical protein
MKHFTKSDSTSYNSIGIDIEKLEKLFNLSDKNKLEKVITHIKPYFNEMKGNSIYLIVTKDVKGVIEKGLNDYKLKQAKEKEAKEKEAREKEAKEKEAREAREKEAREREAKEKEAREAREKEYREKEARKKEAIERRNLEAKNMMNKTPVSTDANQCRPGYEWRDNLCRRKIK